MRACGGVLEQHLLDLLQHRVDVQFGLEADIAHRVLEDSLTFREKGLHFLLVLGKVVDKSPASLPAGGQERDVRLFSRLEQDVKNFSEDGGSQVVAVGPFQHFNQFVHFRSYRDRAGGYQLGRMLGRRTRANQLVDADARHDCRSRAQNQTAAGP